MSENTAEEVQPVEEEYEVERIVGHKLIKYKKAKKFSYLIKWLNYDDADNTWEKEENVFALDLVANYWSTLPKSDPDRIIFQEVQSKKKDPIFLDLPPAPKVAKVISHASPSPPSSPVLKPSEPVIPTIVAAPETEEKEPAPETEEEPTPEVANIPEPTAANISDSRKPEGTSKISSIVSPFFQPVARKDSTPPVATASPSTPTITTTITTKHQNTLNKLYTQPSPVPTLLKDKEKEDELPKPVTPVETVDTEMKSPEDVVMVSPQDDKDYVEPSPSNESIEEDDDEVDINEVDINEVDIDEVDIDEVEEQEEDEDEENELAEEEEGEEDESDKRELRSSLRKRTRSAYTDYFIEQHKRKKLSKSSRKRRREPYDDDTSSVESEIKKIGILKDSDPVIYDKSYTDNVNLDWGEQAQKIEYIGREVPGGPIYCLVLWKSDIRTLHSLDLVRKKRADLVIDAFVELIST